jgi:hypothetical protein
VAVGGPAAPLPAARERHDAERHRVKASQKHAARPAHDAGPVADTVTQEPPMTDYEGSTTAVRPSSGATSQSYGGTGPHLSAGTRSAPAAAPVSGGASVNVPGVASVGAVSQITGGTSLHLPASVAVPRPPLP